MKIVLSLIVLSLTVFSSYSQIREKIGEELLKTFSTPHPYKGNAESEYKKVWSENIYEENATYIAVHFKKLELHKNDYLVIRNPDNSRYWKYSNLDNQRKSFWSIHIYGEKLVIEIFSKESDGSYGYEIDKIAKGFVIIDDSDFRAICGQDDTMSAKCFMINEPFIYEKSKAVARLLIQGTSACTGWLIGSEGHLMTNEHCIQNQSDANNVIIEFMAESSSCNIDCNVFLGCSGNIVATSTTLVKKSSNLDYSLLKLPVNISQTYGYLQLRSEGAIVNEKIYIPQHPSGWAKRIAYNSSHPNDTDGFARVQTITAPRCGGVGSDVGYYADTRNGSSGSPVLGYDDNFVVALHHCGSCLNRGVPIQQIIDDLGKSIPKNALGSIISGPDELCIGDIGTYHITNVPNNATITWSATYILSGQGTNEVTIGAFTGNPTMNLSVEIDYNNNILNYDKTISVVPQNTSYTPTISLHPNNPSNLTCCGQTYTFPHAQCTNYPSNGLQAVWEWDIQYQNPLDIYGFSQTGISANITAQKNTYSPLIVTSKAGYVNPPCTTPYNWSDTVTRYYGTISLSKVANSESLNNLSIYNSQLPVKEYFIQNENNLYVETLSLYEWLDLKYSNKNLDKDETQNIINMLNNEDSFNNMNIQVYDFYGVKVFNENYGEGNHRINFSDLSNGVYFIKYNFNQFNTTRKIIKK